MNNSLHIRHYRSWGMHEHGVITVVSRRETHNGHNHFYYGVAYCSPRDQFSRKSGVELATNRLNNTIPGYSGMVSVNNSISSGRVSRAILSDIEANGCMPRWAEPVVLELLINEAINF